MSEPQGQNPEFPRDAEEARVDLARTREELGRTVQALENKLQPATQARDQASRTATRMYESLPQGMVNGTGRAAAAARRNRTTVLTSAAGTVVLALLAKRRRNRRARDLSLGRGR